MKTKLIAALTFSVLASSAFADDGFDRTGTAAFIATAHERVGSATVAKKNENHAIEPAVAADGSDRADAASTN
ncbi:hypothetical protein QMK47_23070 [Pseudomonas sp. P9_35]|uniref:hypothetical protein n=1 Tax=unclassified Pseudomonas TaxID=196821 RepID=UPI002A35B458|nr:MULTISPECIES: hypothetical protein [unclassified Pseudomonas]WPN62380.1 hypothetical protein QMK48_22175 [Pseudomonas sp. P9_32]WPN68135.1 hypothetical protein QMK47_23070 [Pseudomonas sp. P9_35]